jgi:hypothetical protein
MVKITKIETTIVTDDTASSQADGRVFLGICGREFRCDTGLDDFERADERIYVFGDGANVAYSYQNDPSRPQLQLEKVDQFPLYVRFDDRNDNPWKLKSVKVKLNDGGRQFVNLHSHLWLGLHSGAFCYLEESTSPTRAAPRFVAAAAKK